jgi:hypothetical protein
VQSRNFSSLNAKGHSFHFAQMNFFFYLIKEKHVGHDEYFGQIVIFIYRKLWERNLLLFI